MTAKVIAVRSRFVPERIEAQVGDTLTVHVTNIEQTGDMIHGFGVNEHNMNIVIDPGETKTFKVKLNKPGVFPFYCTNFCSALHQEMQGYLVVQQCGRSPQLPGADSGDSSGGSRAAVASELPGRNPNPAAARPRRAAAQHCTLRSPTPQTVDCRSTRMRV